MGDSEPLFTILDPYLKNPLLATYICFVLQYDTKPLKTMTRRNLIGSYVEIERFRRPGVRLDDLYGEIEAGKLFGEIKASTVRRCYEDWRKSMKASRDVLPLILYALRIR